MRKRLVVFAASVACHVIVFGMVSSKTFSRTIVPSPLSVEIFLPEPLPDLAAPAVPEPALPPPPIVSPPEPIERPPRREETRHAQTEATVDQTLRENDNPSPTTEAPARTPQRVQQQALPPRAPQGPSREQAAVRSILCLRLKGQDRVRYGCPSAPENVQQGWAEASTQVTKEISERYVASLASKDLKSTYFERWQARNDVIPLTMPGGIDNGIFAESDGRDPSAERIRQGQRPYWDAEYRRALKDD